MPIPVIPNHFTQCQITDLIRSHKVHKSQRSRERELVSARAAVNNGVMTPANPPPPHTPPTPSQRTTWSRPSGPFGGGSLRAHGRQRQQLKSRRAARKRGEKDSSEAKAPPLGRKVAPAADESVQLTCSCRPVALVGGRKLALGSGEGSRRRNAQEEVVNLAQDQIRIRIRVEERSYVGSCSH